MKKIVSENKGASGVAYLIAVIAILVAVASVAALMNSNSSTTNSPTPTTAQPTPTAPNGSSQIFSGGSNSQKQGIFELVTPTPTAIFTPKPLPTTPPTSAVTPTTPATGPTPTSQPLSGCTYPSQIFDLTNWKLTLPIGSSSPTEIFQPQLTTYFIDPWFKVNNACDGVQFRAHTSAPVTTATSNYPRSELREMINSGSTNASWSNTTGTHTMFIDEAITNVPVGKKHVVAGQIHDPSNDVVVIRLEYPTLFVDINGVTGPTLDPAYTLGKRFTVKFVAANGKIDIFYNSGSTPAFTLTKNISGSYFKAGVYTQSNCSKEPLYGATCSDTNYGEVIIYNLWVQHQ